MKTSPIVIASSQELIRAGLVNLLHQFGTILVITNEEEFYREIKKITPKILIVDRWFGNLLTESNIEETNLIFEKHTTILFSEPDKETIYKFHKLNISGYFTLENSNQEIIDTISNVLMGAKHFTNKIVDVLIEYSLKRKSTIIQKQPHEDLTERELEILVMLSQGINTKEIAEKLYLSTHTIYTHRKNILKKLSCNSAGELINYAHSQGLIE